MDAPPSTLAAIDLGSNSFHMVIGREIGGQLSILDRLREPVRLYAGLSDDGELAQETLDRALASLERFRQRLVEVPDRRARAVGTHTFRLAEKPRDLLGLCGEVLGVPIEILPGPEEARLIYLGVSHELGAKPGRRLVVDIGGGSTECILGEGFGPFLTDSMNMGCVAYSQRFFPGGKLDLRSFQRAEIAARVELESIRRGYRRAGWQEAVGSSGTIRAVEDILHATGIEEGPITLRGVKRLRKELVRAGSVERLSLPGLQAERAPVFPGGLAILKGILQSLGVEAMATSRAALREGLLYDLLGRIRHEDVRDRTIGVLTKRYHVDLHQAARVEHTALVAFEGMRETWNLPQRGRQLLRWAALLHEIGLAVSYSGHHKHGAYIVTYGDMPGFSREEKLRLAALVRGHRRKLSSELLVPFSAPERELLLRLCVLLRLAVLLHRARSPRPLPAMTFRGGPRSIDVLFPPGWLADHSLIRADLEEEAASLARVDLELVAR